MSVCGGVSAPSTGRAGSIALLPSMASLNPITSAAAPTTPASFPRDAWSILVGRRRCATFISCSRSRAGPRYGSPASMTPPPSTITCGSKRFTTFDRPDAQRTARRTQGSLVRVSSSWRAAWPTCFAVIADGVPAKARIDDEGSFSTASIPIRLIAFPDANCSRHPRSPQGHGGPFGSMTMCPSLGGGTRCAAEEATLHDEPAPDPGPDRDHRDVVQTLGGPEPVLTPHRRVGIVLDHDGDIDRGPARRPRRADRRR